MADKTHITCSECGKLEKLRWMEDIKEKLIKRQLCFTCNFWMERVNQVNNPNSVRIRGSHYWIQKENAPKGSFRGFGGKKFKIVFFTPTISIAHNTPRTIITTNLWNQGEIPGRFRNRLPDNAEFKTLKIGGVLVNEK